MTTAPLIQALERALAPAVSGALRVPAVTAIVANAADRDSLGTALPVVIAALERAGVPRGRAFVLLAAPGGVVAAAGVVSALRAAAGVTVLAHDPATSPCFTPGLDARGNRIHLDDELREAEAIVLLGALAPAGAAGLAALIHPGLAPADAAALDAREVAERIGVDLCVLWSEAASGAVEAWAGEGLAVEDRARASTRGAQSDATLRIP